MTVIPSVFEATKDTSALTLARYAQLIRYDEAAFFGVNKYNNRERDCRKIWTKLERDQIARYLGQAQSLIEGVLLYPIGQKWYADEQHHNVHPIFTKWARIQSLGTMAVSDIALGVALDHTTDPATFVAQATTVTDENEIHFYIAGTDDEILPNTMTLSGGTVTATFPRPRLVLAAFQDNPDTGLDYTDTAITGPFAQAIDIKRIYADSTDVGEFVWPFGKTCQTVGCAAEETEPACGYIHSSFGGLVTLRPTVSSTCFVRRAPVLRINYCAGQPLDAESEDAILHLAHALMPVAPCPGCDPLSVLWKQDQFVPDEITAQRADSMFGVQAGAYKAWNYAHNHKHLRTPML